MEELREWNKKEFGNIMLKLKGVREELRGLQKKWYELGIG